MNKIIYSIGLAVAISAFAKTTIHTEKSDSTYVKPAIEIEKSAQQKLVDSDSISLNIKGELLVN